MYTVSASVKLYTVLNRIELYENNTTSQKANIIISYVDLYSQTLKRIDKGYRI